ncbi:MAG: hypothetical protein QOJ19_4985 [Acidimicrobiia bacterium]|nr:hypothetical protein [Acidimicrobiia bacterium]
MRTFRVELKGKIIGPPFRYEEDAHWWVHHWHPGERYSVITVGGFRQTKVEYLPSGAPAAGKPSGRSILPIRRKRSDEAISNQFTR